ncbi:hypothetical protein [Mycolicibacterium goodii]|uniref:Transmembrane protein n=1 Tax=Mycolicibacterium goodii TaxID=134601 RepID=A0ABS6HSG9_MYCGD|nr:hypothetical protein [Mycolicibacterium goodii]MBU8825644.1 hypothetical protein [Mycolicibacterium goodii]MBU8836416.1 hypothetical protein [Mycolicibacterium goodii]
MSDSGPLDTDQAGEDDHTRIIRRQPSAPLSGPVPTSDAPKTSIIRRHPTGAIPTAPDAEPQTSLIGASSDAQTGLMAAKGAGAGADGEGDEDAGAATAYVPRARPVVIPRRASGNDPKTAVTAATLSILSGWGTAVIATDLIAGWWRTDQLFCVAVGFLTAVSAAATIGGLIALLLRRRLGRLLIVVGSIIALLIFGSLFIAGAKLHPMVYAIPVLPVASILFTVLPATGRWAVRSE